MPDALGPELLPVFLKLGGKPVVVVGAGPVAEGKIERLLAAGAQVVVVAPEATAGVEALATAGRVVLRARGFLPADSDGAWLVFASTSDAAVQASVAAAADARRLFCIAVDDPAHASAYSGAVVRRPPFTLAVSSSGATPALTRLVRELIEQMLPGESWVEEARALRARWLAEQTPMADRFAELVRVFKARAGA